jgi:hypothetical protein
MLVIGGSVRSVPVSALTMPVVARVSLDWYGAVIAHPV